VGRDASDRLGLALTGLTLALGIGWAARRKPAPSTGPVPGIVPHKSPGNGGGVIPALIVVVLGIARFVPQAKPDPKLREQLYERASKAFGEDRFEDAAEYARHALDLETSSSLRAELLCLRGESLLRAADPRGAPHAFPEGAGGWGGRVGGARAPRRPAARAPAHAVGEAARDSLSCGS